MVQRDMPTRDRRAQFGPRFGQFACVLNGARNGTSVTNVIAVGLTVMECQPPRIMKALAMTVSLTPNPSPSGRGELRESLARLSR